MDGNLNRTRFYYDGGFRYAKYCSLNCFVNIVEWTFTFQEEGWHFVAVNARDQLGSLSNVVSWSITVLKPNPPTIQARSPPAFNNVTAGGKLSFVAHVEDVDGDLNGTEFIAGNRVSFDPGCFANCSDDDASATFDFPEVGTYYVSASAVDMAGARSPLVSWRVNATPPEGSTPPPPPNRPPTIFAVSPSSNATTYSGDALQFSVRAEDPDSNLYEAWFQVDGAYMEPSRCSYDCSLIDGYWSYSFEGPGTSHTVRAGANDSQGLHSLPLSWNVSVQSQPPPPTGSSDPAPPSPTPTPASESPNPGESGAPTGGEAGSDHAGLPSSDALPRTDGNETLPSSNSLLTEEDSTNSSLLRGQEKASALSAGHLFLAVALLAFVLRRWTGLRRRM